MDQSRITSRQLANSLLSCQSIAFPNDLDPSDLMKMFDVVESCREKQGALCCGWPEIPSRVRHHLVCRQSVICCERLFSSSRVLLCDGSVRHIGTRDKRVLPASSSCMILCSQLEIRPQFFISREVRVE